MRKLIILDFDGTIYKGDSMRDFAKFLNRFKYFYSLLIISFPFILSSIGLINRDIIKKIFLKINFKSYSKNELTLKGREFFKAHKNRLYPKAIEFIKNHEQDTCIILSGSCSEWLTVFGEHFNMKIFTTKLQYDSKGFCSGSIDGLNNVGENKILKIKEQLKLSEFDEVLSFGDSKSDRILKKISTEYHHQFFHD